MTQTKKQDILKCRTPTTGVVRRVFEIDNRNFEVLLTGGQRSERRGWVHCFGTVGVVCQFVSLQHFDQGLYEIPDINATHEDLQLWDETLNSRFFNRSAFAVIFTHIDLFKTLIQEKDLRICFEDYTGDNTFTDGFKFFKEKFESIVNGRDVYFFTMNCLDDADVKRVFDEIQAIGIESVNGRLRRAWKNGHLTSAKME